MSLHDVTKVFQVHFVVVGVELGLTDAICMRLVFMSWLKVVKTVITKLERQEVQVVVLFWAS